MSSASIVGVLTLFPINPGINFVPRTIGETPTNISPGANFVLRGIEVVVLIDGQGIGVVVLANGRGVTGTLRIAGKGLVAGKYFPV